MSGRSHFVLRGRLQRLALYAFVYAAGALLTVPFYYMTITSLKPLEEIARIPISLTLSHPTLDPYRTLLEGLAYGRFMMNSLFVATLTMAGSLFFCTLAGYAFAKHTFPHRDALFLMLLSTMLIPGTVLLVPGFLLMRDFGWLNTFLPLIVPNMAGAFNTFLARQFIEDVPDSLIEAARIDGCGPFRVYWQIILPLSRPLLATLGILTFLWNWNNFIGPLIFILDESKFTLPLGLALLQGRYTKLENIQMAGAALAILPVLVLFFFFQKQIVKSLSTSGLKE